MNDRRSLERTGGGNRGRSRSRSRSRDRDQYRQHRSRSHERRRGRSHSRDRLVEDPDSYRGTLGSTQDHHRRRRRSTTPPPPQRRMPSSGSRRDDNERVETALQLIHAKVATSSQNAVALSEEARACWDGATHLIHSLEVRTETVLRPAGGQLRTWSKLVCVCLCMRAG